MKFFTPSFLLVAFFVMGGIMFKSMAPRGCATILPDDTVFVLTGDARRIPYALRQTKNLPYTDMHIIGAGAEEITEIRGRAHIESDSKSTYQNAIAIRDISRRAGLDRIVIVTTEDHMNRAQYLIRNELPDVEIAVCAAPLTGMPAAKRLERWTTEYVKYIVTTIFGIKEG